MSQNKHRPNASAASAPAASELSAAAAALDAALRRFEDLAAALRRCPLHSQKHFDQASRVAREAAECQRGIAEHLQALVAAVGTTRDRQQVAAEAINARVDEIDQRAAVFNVLHQRFGKLGEEARAINGLVQEAAARRRPPAPGTAPETAPEAAPETTPETTPETVARFEAVRERMGRVVDDARALADDARAAEMHDLAQQADALRQQLQSARNRLGLLQQSLGGAG